MGERYYENTLDVDIALLQGEMEGLWAYIKAKVDDGEALPLEVGGGVLRDRVVAGFTGRLVGFTERVWRLSYKMGREALISSSVYPSRIGMSVRQTNEFFGSLWRLVDAVRVMNDDGGGGDIETMKRELLTLYYIVADKDEMGALYSWRRSLRDFLRDRGSEFSREDVMVLKEVDFAMLYVRHLLEGWFTTLVVTMGCVDDDLKWNMYWTKYLSMDYVLRAEDLNDGVGYRDDRYAYENCGWGLFLFWVRQHGRKNLVHIKESYETIVAFRVRVRRARRGAFRPAIAGVLGYRVGLPPELREHVIEMAGFGRGLERGGEASVGGKAWVHALENEREEVRRARDGFFERF